MFHLLAMGVALQAILVESGEWTQIRFDGNGPLNVHGQVAFLVPSQDVIFVWGGEEEGALGIPIYPDETNLFSLNDMTWSVDSPNGRPDGRKYALAAVPGDRKEVWVMGGEWHKTYDQDLWRYDLDSKTWTEYVWDYQLDSPLKGQHYISHARMLWTGEEMWIYTGDSDIWSFRLPENKETTSIVWTKKTWFAAFGARKTYRMSFVAVWASARREMYVHGGVDYSTAVFGDLWKYSDNSNVWEQINFDGGPQARAFHVGVWREEKEELFIQGGIGDVEIFSDLWKYSVPDNTWTLLSQSAPARTSSVGVWLPKTQEIWLHGGYCVPKMVDCTEVWKFALMDNCGAFSCAAGTVRKDHAEDIGSFGQSECCNNITATTTSTYTTATTTFVTITTSTVSRTTVTGTTMTGTSTATSTATEQWEEANAANALGGKELQLELIAAVVAIITSHI